MLGWQSIPNEFEQITFCLCFLTLFIYKGFEIAYHFFLSLKHSETLQQSLLPIKHTNVNMHIIQSPVNVV